MSKIAYLFPGQGSQSVGMGQELCSHSAAARMVFDEADRVLGAQLSNLCFNGPEDTLRQTVYTQPALFTVSVAALAVLGEAGAQPPHAAAGHSIGEYAALFAAGVFDFETGLRLVERRAQEMQRAAEAGSGAMAAVLGLAAGTVVDACREVEAKGLGSVQAANFNGAGQVVVSGSPEGIAAVSEILKEKGAKRVLPLAVSGAFHSRAMKPAADALGCALEAVDLREARFPVVANVTAGYESSAAEIRANLGAQVDHSVRWEESMHRLRADGYDTFVEVGAGAVLTGLIKRMFADAAAFSVKDRAGLEAFLAACPS